MRSRRGFGALEADVLGVLWASDRPMTAGELVEQLGTQLAYNTVQTVLARLYAKGVVQRQQVGRAHAYTAVLDQAGLAAQKMRAVLDRGQDSEAVLLRFVDSLSDAEGQALSGLLDRFRPPNRARPSE